MATVRKSTKSYVQRERVEGDFDSERDMQFWLIMYKRKGFKVSGLSYVTGAPYRAVATRNKLRKTFTP